MLDDGTIDLALDSGRPPQAPTEQIQRYQANRTLGRVSIDKRDSIRYITFRLPQPPFDDVHVRKALNFLVDRKRMVDHFGGSLVGEPTGHISIDSFENNALISYDPYRTRDDAERLAMAKAEMRQSRYDTDGDGMCDAAACRGVRGIANSLDELRPAVKEVGDAARRIGIMMTMEYKSPRGELFPALTDPANHYGIGMFPAWIKDLFNASTFMEPLFASSGIGGNNWTLMGATASQLRTWGYATSSVPSADERIEQCSRIFGREQTSCWAALDQYLMENVVPWIPFLSENHIQIIPARVVAYEFDQFSTLPALDHIAIKR